jgi:hypothetical protein
MRLFKKVLLIVAIAVMAASVWVWWNRPRRVDMAAYAPSDALVYIECNSLLDVGESIVNTKAWRELWPLLDAGNPRPPRSWLRRVISWTGIASTETVILTRSQVAAVMLDLGASERGENLTIKPEAAILVQTHTSERRIRPVIKDAVRRFAEAALPGATMQERDASGAEVMVWSAPAKDRHIVATINGSLVIVGNSERAVQACLDAQRGLRPNLQSHPELQQMRQTLGAEQALGFGFVSSTNSARLITAAAPLVTGTAPGDLRFDRVIAGGASKILSGIGWSSRAVQGHIEDRYVFLLTPNLVSRLHPFFQPPEPKLELLEMLPENVYSVTFYNFEDPIATWKGVQMHVSAQLDTLSAIVFTSVFKTALSSYGIEDPEKFLQTVGPDIVTARLEGFSERSVLIAPIRDEAALRQILRAQFGPQAQSFRDGELVEIPGKQIGVTFMDGNVILGNDLEVKMCVGALMLRRTASNTVKRLTETTGDSNSASITTYTRDDERVLSFFRGIARAESRTFDKSPDLQSKLEQLPYASTRTTLSDRGLERKTVSSLGQFGNVVPLLFPER